MASTAVPGPDPARGGLYGADGSLWDGCATAVSEGAAGLALLVEAGLDADLAERGRSSISAKEAADEAGLRAGVVAYDRARRSDVPRGLAARDSILKMCWL